MNFRSLVKGKIPSFIASLSGALILTVGARQAQAVNRLVPSQYATIQSAINAAVNGDVVLIANGTYGGVGNYNIDFGGKAIKVQSASDNATLCIVDCTGGRGFIFQRGETAAAVVRGLTITRGGVAGNGGGILCQSNSNPTITRCIISSNIAQTGGWTGGAGGGMYCNNSSPTVTDCTFSANWTGGAGGGMASCGGRPAVTNCTFNGNVALQAHGGGMYNASSNPNINDSSPIITNCTFISNSAVYGAGMENAHSNAIIHGCFFTNNTANDSGGMLNNNCSPDIRDCTFSGNTAQYGIGGGLSNQNHSSPAVTNCLFTSNSAPSGGGMGNLDSSSPTVSGCTFTTNSSTYGGAMRNLNGCSPKLTNCTFTRNTAAYGGAIDNYALSNPTVTSCLYNGNRADWGGAMATDNSSPVITNTVFTMNTAQTDIANYVRGGGIYINNGSRPVVTNCTFTSNMVVTTAYPTYCWGGGIVNMGGSTATVANCIFWGNSAATGAQVYNESGSTLTLTYSDVQGGYAGTGNLNADPRFVRAPSNGADGVRGTADDDFGDLRLLAASTCKDAGLDSAVPAGITTDLAGLPRFSGSHVGQGAYEYQNRPPVAVNDTKLVYTGTTTVIYVLTNDSDPDNDALTITAVTQPAHYIAGITLDKKAVTFTTSGLHYIGTFPITYTISDGKGGTATATVSVKVSNPIP